MPRYLNLTDWPRRDAFAYFRGFDKPYFNVCVRLDVAPLKAALARAGGGLSLAYHYLALRLAHQIEPFRYRIDGEHVRVHDSLSAGLTVLRDDDSFGFAYIADAADFARFARDGRAAMAAARTLQTPFDPRVGDTAMVHFTTLPWVHFSSFSHARNWGRDDSIPKIAFGRIDQDGPHAWLPCSVEVHHALMDGLHVGRYVQAFEAALREPERWIGCA